MNLQRPSLRPLTAFRFFAALAVFFHHMDYYCGRDPLLAKVYPSILYEGFSGVTFFFVLSGFILTYNYHHVFATFRWPEAWKFYAARFARIYPVHVLTFIAMLPLCYGAFLVATGTATLRAVANLTLTQSYIPRNDYYFSYNAPSWSLSDEFFFYASLPFLLWSLVSLRLARGSRPAVLSIGFLALALGLAWHWRNDPRFHWLCYINPVCRCVDFTAGVTLCLAYLTMREWLTGKGPRIIATVLEFACLAGLAVAVYYAQAVPFAVRLGSYYTPAMAAIIFIFAFQRGWLSALVSTRPFWVLGEISFSFYMFHMVVLCYAKAYTVQLHLDRLGPRTSILIFFATTLLISFLCHYGFERPMRERLKRWLVRDAQEDGKGRTVGAVPKLRQAA
jgi:peptidoglycan/LPS O-acetylase OafA/YrhL